MRLRRNLDYPESTDVTKIGPAALDDLLERGDLQSWALLAQAVKKDPDGPLADTVLRLCETHRMYGTSRLWAEWIEGLRSGKSGLSSLRRRWGLSQTQVAQWLGISQSDVSKLERRTDLRVSTLEAYIRATGGRLKLTAAYDNEEIDVRLPHRG